MQQQQMGASLVPQATAGLSPRLRAAANGRSLSSGAHGSCVVALSGQARDGWVTAARVAAQHKYYCRCQLLDQHVPSRRSTAQRCSLKDDKFFEVEMKVRDDELDKYGVVNNAIYACYLHRGCDVLLEEFDIGVDYWTSTGNALALSELSLKYFAPLRSGDKFVVKVKPVQLKGVQVIMHHLIETLPDRKLVLQGRATVICLNKDFRPTRVFPELSSVVVEAFSCKVD